jgi:hypothetical protein
MKKDDRKLTIDWDDLRKGYNDQHNTTYKTVEDFVRKIYLKYRTIEKTSRVLGTSRYALWKKMKALNIPRLPKGHRGACKSLRAIWGLDNVLEMTSGEIAKATGLTRNWVLVVLKRHNILFAKELNRNAGLWGRIKPVTQSPESSLERL